jgi:hypothetical protein
MCLVNKVDVMMTPTTTNNHSLTRYVSSQDRRCDDDTNHYLTINHSLAMCLAKMVDVMMTPTTT